MDEIGEPPRERRWACRGCPKGCVYISVDPKKPKAIKRPCLDDRAKVVDFEEA